MSWAAPPARFEQPSRPRSRARTPSLRTLTGRAIQPIRVRPAHGGRERPADGDDLDRHGRHAARLLGVEVPPPVLATRPARSRCADTDGNDATIADPAWLPLGPVPNHPEYPAAHACIAGTLSETLKQAFGTRRLSFSFNSTVTGTTHTWATLGDMADELARGAHLGRHALRTSLVHGTVLGRDGQVCAEASVPGASLTTRAATSAPPECVTAPSCAGPTSLAYFSSTPASRSGGRGTRRRGARPSPLARDHQVDASALRSRCATRSPSRSQRNRAAAPPPPGRRSRSSCPGSRRRNGRR